MCIRDSPLWMHWPGIEVAVANMHRGSKLYQNQWNNSWYIAFDNFFKQQYPLSWSFFKLHFWTTVMLWIANACYRAKFHQNMSNVCKDVIKVWIFHQFGMKTVICTFFRCFGVKNRRKLKLSALASLYDCTDLKLKLQWLICIVAANFIKISEIIADISHLTTFLNSSIHYCDLF